MAMLLFVVSMTALTSCKKEAENLILGKWECVSASYTQDGETYTVSEVNGMVWEFKANGTVTASFPGDLDYDDEDVSTASYIVSDNLLTITSIDEDGEVDTETYTIKELTKTKLLLEEREDEDVASIEFKKI